MSKLDVIDLADSRNDNDAITSAVSRSFQKKNCSRRDLQKIVHLMFLPRKEAYRPHGRFSADTIDSCDR